MSSYLQFNHSSPPSPQHPVLPPPCDTEPPPSAPHSQAVGVVHDGDDDDDDAAAQGADERNGHDIDYRRWEVDTSGHAGWGDTRMADNGETVDMGRVGERTDHGIEAGVGVGAGVSPWRGRVGEVPRSRVGVEVGRLCGGAEGGRVEWGMVGKTGRTRVGNLHLGQVLEVAASSRSEPEDRTVGEGCRSYHGSRVLVCAGILHLRGSVFAFVLRRGHLRLQGVQEEGEVGGGDGNAGGKTLEEVSGGGGDGGGVEFAKGWVCSGMKTGSGMEVEGLRAGIQSILFDSGDGEDRKTEAVDENVVGKIGTTAAVDDDGDDCALPRVHHVHLRASHPADDVDGVGDEPRDTASQLPQRWREQAG
ncbi:hypothetical protein BC829DRAFT_413167 [Chytridium lagenaria]|nr:hypothetical protein BC829DRAFT_413167 [Chytridium lagenaria]